MGFPWNMQKGGIFMHNATQLNLVKTFQRFIDSNDGNITSVVRGTARYKAAGESFDKAFKKLMKLDEDAAMELDAANGELKSIEEDALYIAGLYEGAMLFHVFMNASERDWKGAR
jgi:hypothetical protein